MGLSLLRQHVAAANSITAALLIAGCAACGEPGYRNETETRTVVRVIDGDTVVLDRGVRVRLLGIDAPERGWPGYAEAAEFLRRAVEGRAVRIEYDCIAGRKGKYRRTLAYIHAPGGGVVNEELLRRGLAEPTWKFAHTHRERYIRLWQKRK